MREDALMDGGCTKNRRAIPPIEYPIICVDMTTIHWSREERMVNEVGRKVLQPDSQLKLYTWL